MALALTIRICVIGIGLREGLVFGGIAQDDAGLGAVGEVGERGVAVGVVVCHGTGAAELGIGMSLER